MAYTLYAMLRFSLTAVVAMAAMASVRADSTLWYGGDADNIDGIAATHGPVRSSTLCDDFDIAPGGAVVSGVFGSYLALGILGLGGGGPPTEADYEIRSGVSAGSSGTLIAADRAAASWSLEDDTTQFWRYRATVSGLNLFLPEGRYWLSLSPVRSVELYLATTSGENGIGSPLDNGDSYWTAPWVDAYFTPTTEILGTDRRPTWDFSYGVAGNPVPEPGAFLSLSVLSAFLVKSKLNRRTRPSRS
jgi:hypothetical protein